MSKNAQRNIDILAIIIGLIIVSILSFLFYKISTSEHKTLSISYIALLIGVLFESFRISDNWKSVIYLFIGSLLFSLICFIPYKNEADYLFENHLKNWPYYFLIFFAVVSSIFNSEKTTIKLTEGLTLIQTISVIYWLLDYGIYNLDNWGTKISLVIILIFSIMSVFHSLSYHILTRTTRLILSIWSSIIMLLFATDNIYRVFNYGEIENSKYFSQSFYIGIQYFLLGVSSIYIIQNIIMLIGFFPGKGTFFNAQYFKELRELKKEHIERYSEKQVNIFHSIFCILLTGTFYYLNYKYQYFPRHTTIWIGFILFPVFLKLVALRQRQ
jgi:hypothetical protein